MHLVTAGGRLEPPNSSTPSQVYTLMCQCWNTTPEFRPNFSTIIERIGSYLQDTDILNVPLPIFQRSASIEKDVSYHKMIILLLFIFYYSIIYIYSFQLTLMRAPPDSTEYLVPNNPGSQTNSNYSMATEKTELMSPDTCSTMSYANEDKIWNEEALANQLMPFNINSMTNYSNNPRIQNNSGIVLNPNNLHYQQSCVRYVNLNNSNSNNNNNNNDLFGCNINNVSNIDNLVSNQVNEVNKPHVNCS